VQPTTTFVGYRSLEKNLVRWLVYRALTENVGKLFFIATAKQIAFTSAIPLTNDTSRQQLAASAAS
jgi:hypothetical protein